MIRLQSLFFLIIFLVTSNPTYADTEGLQATLQSNCDKGIGRACYKLGHFFDDESSHHLDEVKASRSYMAGCKAKYSLSCDAFAEKRTKLTPKSLLFKEFERNCKHSGAQDCYFLAYLEKKSNRLKDAEARFRLLCESNLAVACAALASIKNSQKNETEAIQLYLKACRLGDTVGCLEAGNALTKNLRQDSSEGQNAFLQGCKFGDYTNCYYAGFTFKRKGQWKQALQHYQTACDNYYSEGCWMSGFLSYYSNKLEEAETPLTFGCYQGDCAKCCKFLGDVLSSQLRDSASAYKKATELFESSCNKKSEDSCKKLAELKEHMPNSFFAKLWRWGEYKVTMLFLSSQIKTRMEKSP